MTLLGGAIGIPSNGLRLLSRLRLYDAMASRGKQTPSVILHSTRGSIVGEMDMIGWSEKHTGFGDRIMHERGYLENKLGIILKEQRDLKLHAARILEC